MTQLQDKIGSLEAPPKVHRGFSFARWLVTAFYGLMFFGSIFGPIPGLHPVLAALVATVIYIVADAIALAL
jgi:hypothetical protein